MDHYYSRFSPDLAQTHFWLFDKIKFCLSDQPEAQSLCEVIKKNCRKYTAKRVLKNVPEMSRKNGNLNSP